MSDSLVSRTAMRDTRCELCEGMILGQYGRRTPEEVEDLERESMFSGQEPEPAHPWDTLDQIVKLPQGGWVHVGCAEDQGHVVINT